MAASGFATPSLSWNSPNLPEAFRSFRQYSTLIFDGPFANRSEKEKVTYLLLRIGSHGRDIYDGWTRTTPDDKFKLHIVLKNFQRHIEPQVNSYLARYTFHKCRQAAGESVDEFITRCRVIAAKCKFTDLMETNIRLTEQLIVGTKHVEVQEKLLEKGDALASLEAASMEAAMDIARTYEATKAHVAQLQATPATAEVVHDVGTRKPKRPDNSCTRCGLNHGDTGKCPAHGHKCGKCGRPNHWARFCKTKRSGRSGTPHRQRGRSTSSSRPSGDGRTRVDEVTDDLETLVFQTVSLDSINDDQKERTQAFFTLSLSIVNPFACALSMWKKCTFDKFLFTGRNFFCDAKLQIATHIYSERVFHTRSNRTKLINFEE